MRNLWCLEKNSILPLVISATGIVPQSLFKNLKILDLDNTLVVEIQKGKETPVIMLISTALLLDSNIRNSVCTPAKLPCRRVEVG
jgi:hypothetical protein